MFEIAVSRGVEGDGNRHLLTERELRFSSSATPAIAYLSLIPKGFELLAKVIHVAKQFRKIHWYPLHFGLLAQRSGEDTFCAELVQDRFP